MAAATCAAAVALPSPDGRFLAEHAAEGSSLWRCRLRRAQPDAPLTWADTAALWESDASFGEWTSALLAACPFPAFYWEAPALTQRVAATAAGPAAFREHLAPAAARGDQAATFPNLGGDAVLVAPACGPGAAHKAVCGDIGSFTRGAPPPAQAALWAAVGRALRSELAARGERPTWLNTEGSAVPWLHVRLDSAPKYYHHRPYAAPPR
eukprot:TRINITY_DN13705_c0_g1_i1.p2 TRINITY_DN13705_c0_g1~~TRINITY_DN13705_c0_g1_i1.p2  ORF type:complete len:209 (+),score=57.06 TRINITY_DN13705_c0_g1_i1:82-708(+)